jgi:hypothetical protein
MCDEHDLIEENHTWSLADLPAGKIVVKWVYKLKGDAASNILKHKARLVAKGYVERPGIDFDEVFAMVACLDSVRLLLASPSLLSSNGRCTTWTSRRPS